MSEPAQQRELDQQHERLDQIQEHIDEAKATAQHLADERLIEPDDDAEKPRS